MSEFKIGPLTCRAKTMDARKQFHLARRLAGLLKPLLSMVETGPDQDMTAIAGALGDTLATLPDEVMDYVLDTCLDAVEVKQDKGLGWSPLRVKGAMMYDLDLVGMMVAIGQVIQNNLGGFTAALSRLGITTGQTQTSAG